MVAILGMMIFAGAFGVAAGVIALSVAPQWDRIVRTLNGAPDMPARPLQQLVLAERRIAVMRWSAASSPALTSALTPVLLRVAA